MFKWNCKHRCSLIQWLYNVSFGGKTYYRDIIASANMISATLRLIFYEETSFHCVFAKHHEFLRITGQQQVRLVIHGVVYQNQWYMYWLCQLTYCKGCQKYM